MTQTFLAIEPNHDQSSRITRWTDVCGNRECRTGWLQLFRSRSFPRFENKWACSPVCMERMIADAVRSQIESWEPAPTERALRMPLGLILLSRGWISHRELREALAAQRSARTGRIGEWLCRLHGISEEAIAKALGIQWNCAVLSSGIPGLEYMRCLIPAFLRKHYGLALLRQRPDAALYLAGKYRAEYAAAQAVDHMLQEPVHAAFLEDSAWNIADMDVNSATEMYLSERDGVVACIREWIERSRPSDARLVRIHDHLWLRMWLRDRGRHPVQPLDVVFPLRGGDSHGSTTQTIRHR